MGGDLEVSYSGGQAVFHPQMLPGFKLPFIPSQRLS
jgi:hypothetical protein